MNGHTVYFHWHSSFLSVAELKVTATGDEDAYQAAYDIALRMGYTRPRWWQFWRWQDSMPPAPFDVNEPNEKE
jgi:hypothetical protein